jgi:hypothetical protein
MTRKDFVAIAAVLKTTKPFVGKAHNSKPIHAQWRQMVDKFADMCAAQYRGSYGGFDRGRFLAACGVDE